MNYSNVVKNISLWKISLTPQPYWGTGARWMGIYWRCLRLISMQKHPGFHLGILVVTVLSAQLSFPISYMHTAALTLCYTSLTIQSLWTKCQVHLYQIQSWIWGQGEWQIDFQVQRLCWCCKYTIYCPKNKSLENWASLNELVKWSQYFINYYGVTNTYVAGDWSLS